METYTFAGLQIAPANLIFDGNKFAIAEDWKTNSYGKAFGEKKGSTYFNWHECHNVNIDGWRVPTKDEWGAILGNGRPGATYNGQEHARFALIQVNVPFGKRDVCNGLLLFPDDAAINGVEIPNINKTWNDRRYKQTRGITEQQLDELLSQGCVFLPASGYCDDGDDWDFGGYGGGYWSSTEGTEYDAYSLYFGDSYVYPGVSDDKSDGYYPVRLVRE